jgi:hypothetical protein
LPDRARNVVLGLFDIILYGDSVSRKDAAGNLVVDRVLRTKPHSTYEAGDRTGHLSSDRQEAMHFDDSIAAFPISWSLLRMLSRMLLQQMQTEGVHKNQGGLHRKSRSTKVRSRGNQLQILEFSSKSTCRVLDHPPQIA